MLRKMSVMALLAALPALPAQAGVVAAADAPAYGAVYVGSRWQPIVIHFDAGVATGARGLLGMDSPHRLVGNGATYAFVGGTRSPGMGAALPPFGSQADRIAARTGHHRWFEPADDDRDEPFPHWDGHGHHHGGGSGGGGSGEGGGVPAVPLPGTLPLLASALAALLLAWRRVAG